MTLYLGAVVLLAVASIGMLFALFATGFPAFVTAFIIDPGAAIRGDPLSVVLLFASIALVGLLFALIVTFGARTANRAEPE